MSLELGLQIVQAVAVVVGVVFGLLQLHQLRVQREAQGAADSLKPCDEGAAAAAVARRIERTRGLSLVRSRARGPPPRRPAADERRLTGAPLFRPAFGAARDAGSVGCAGVSQVLGHDRQFSFSIVRSFEF